eukprot:scaffold12600_cov107-Isochrysis_galbana.AAC.4
MHSLVGKHDRLVRPIVIQQVVRVGLGVEADHKPHVPRVVVRPVHAHPLVHQRPFQAGESRAQELPTYSQRLLDHRELRRRRAAPPHVADEEEAVDARDEGAPLAPLELHQHQLHPHRE